MNVEDLKRVTAVLHKEIKRGYISPGQVESLAELIAAEREKADAERDALRASVQRVLVAVREAEAMAERSSSRRFGGGLVPARVRTLRIREAILGVPPEAS